MASAQTHGQGTTCAQSVLAAGASTRMQKHGTWTQKKLKHKELLKTPLVYNLLAPKIRPLYRRLADPVICHFDVVPEPCHSECQQKLEWQNLAVIDKKSIP